MGHENTSKHVRMYELGDHKKEKLRDRMEALSIGDARKAVDALFTHVSPIGEEPLGHSLPRPSVDEETSIKVPRRITGFHEDALTVTNGGHRNRYEVHKDIARMKIVFPDVGLSIARSKTQNSNLGLEAELHKTKLIWNVKINPTGLGHGAYRGPSWDPDYEKEVAVRGCKRIFERGDKRFYFHGYQTNDRLVNPFDYVSSNGGMREHGIINVRTNPYRKEGDKGRINSAKLAAMDHDIAGDIAMLRKVFESPDFYKSLVDIKKLLDVSGRDENGGYDLNELAQDPNEVPQVRDARQGLSDIYKLFKMEEVPDDKYKRRDGRQKTFGKEYYGEQFNADLLARLIAPMFSSYAKSGMENGYVKIADGALYHYGSNFSEMKQNFLSYDEQNNIMSRSDVHNHAYKAMYRLQWEYSHDMATEQPSAATDMHNVMMHLLVEMAERYDLPENPTPEQASALADNMTRWASYVYAGKLTQQIRICRENDNGKQVDPFDPKKSLLLSVSDKNWLEKYAGDVNDREKNGQVVLPAEHKLVQSIEKIDFDKIAEAYKKSRNVYKDDYHLDATHLFYTFSSGSSLNTMQDIGLTGKESDLSAKATPEEIDAARLDVSKVTFDDVGKCQRTAGKDLNKQYSFVNVETMYAKQFLKDLRKSNAPDVSELDMDVAKYQERRKTHLMYFRRWHPELDESADKEFWDKTVEEDWKASCARKQKRRDDYNCENVIESKPEPKKEYESLTKGFMHKVDTDKYLDSAKLLPWHSLFVSRYMRHLDTFCDRQYKSGGMEDTLDSRGVSL